MHFKSIQIKRGSTAEATTYWTGAGMSSELWRFFTTGRALEVNTRIVLRMNPFHLSLWLVKWIKTALSPLYSDFSVFMNGVQWFDNRIHSLRISCRHLLCDAYLWKNWDIYCIKTIILQYFNMLLLLFVCLRATPLCSHTFRFWYNSLPVAVW